MNEQKEPTAEALKVGDKVRIKTGDGYYNRREGVITEIWFDAAWVRMPAKSGEIGMSFPKNQLIKI